MKKTLIISLLFITGAGWANTKSEINHLLSHVRNTPCLYERNGSLHNGEEALAHIKKKYNYFKDDIKTAEDFIKYSATKSKISGKYYYIQCPNKKKVKSKDWLMAALAAFRKQNTD